MLDHVDGSKVIEQVLQILVAMLEEMSHVRRSVKALPGQVDAVRNPRVGHAAIRQLRSDRVGLRYEEQSRRVHVVGVKHLRRSDVVLSRRLVECPKMVDHVVLQCILKSRIAWEQRLRHSNRDLCDVGGRVPDLPDDTIDHCLVLGSIFVHLRKALAPNVSTKYFNFNLKIVEIPSDVQLTLRPRIHAEPIACSSHCGP